MSVIADGHLGGYVEGGDPATCYEYLWRNVAELYHLESVLDVGCGDGQAVSYFDKLGVEARGVDGIPQEHPLIFQHDFSTKPWMPPFPPLGGPWDLVWCCEFVEHVDEAYLPNYLWALTMGKRVLMTHAEPGQPGYHHVNCRTAEYWRGVMAAEGFVYDERLTTLTRCWAGENQSAWNHYCRSGLAFTHRDYFMPDEWWARRGS